jgi:hypothetical protein
LKRLLISDWYAGWRPWSERQHPLDDHP